MSARIGMRVIGTLFACLLLASCSTAKFYWQGIAGQIDILSRRQPIAEVEQSTTDPLLKARLQQVQAIRRYASRELDLPDNGSFTTYVDVGRPFVLWNVFAAPPLSLKPRELCYPIAGCVAYRGYFHQEDAKAEAERLAATGDDVYIGGVPAYSLLGYFDDPILSTYIRYREADLARLIFHELAHQVVYVKDDSSFNESFAVAVEEEGLRRWLAAQSKRPDSAQLVADAERSSRLREDFRALIRKTRDRLAALYASEHPDADKLALKAQIFAELRGEFAQLEVGWHGAPAYERWLASGANNAGIAAIGLYDNRVPQFDALLTESNNDLPRFYDEVKTLAKLPKAERETALAAATHRLAATPGTSTATSSTNAPKAGTPGVPPAGAAAGSGTHALVLDHENK